MKKKNRENEEKDTYRQEIEEATDREKVDVGAIRKRWPKIAEDKNTKEKVKQRNRTEERNIKTGNTFSVLQVDDQEPILEKEELLPITKLNKEEKK